MLKKRTLLYVAGCVWSIAGGMLITRALLALIAIQNWLLLEIIIGLIAGICFYIFMFTRISKKHITRISLIKVDKPCFFSFFNFKELYFNVNNDNSRNTLRKTNITISSLLIHILFSNGHTIVAFSVSIFQGWNKKYNSDMSSEYQVMSIEKNIINNNTKQ